MCSEHVILMVPRRCVTNVLGLWDCGGALLRSVEEQQSLLFQSTVRRAAPCTNSCWPKSCELLPCTSTHTFSPNRALALSGCAHSSAHIRVLKLPPVFRAQVGSEAPDPFLRWANASSVPQILLAGAFFAALEMLSVHASAGACVVEGGWRRFARALVTADGCLLVSMY